MNTMRDPVFAVDGFTWPPPHLPPHPPHPHPFPLYKPFLHQLPLHTIFHVFGLHLFRVLHFSECYSGLTLSSFCSYERSSIEAWFAKGKTTSPKTGAELSSEGQAAVRAGTSCAPLSNISQVSFSFPITTCEPAYRIGRPEEVLHDDKDVTAAGMSSSLVLACFCHDNRRQCTAESSVLTLGDGRTMLADEQPDVTLLTHACQDSTEVRRCYDEGLGVVQDYAEAVRLYRLAAAQGHAAADINLGLMFERGRGLLSSRPC
jgi:hypothetical protein